MAKPDVRGGKRKCVSVREGARAGAPKTPHTLAAALVACEHEVECAAAEVARLSAAPNPSILPPAATTPSIPPPAALLSAANGAGGGAGSARRADVMRPSRSVARLESLPGACVEYPVHHHAAQAVPVPFYCCSAAHCALRRLAGTCPVHSLDGFSESCTVESFMEETKLMKDIFSVPKLVAAGAKTKRMLSRLFVILSTPWRPHFNTAFECRLYTVNINPMNTRDTVWYHSGCRHFCLRACVHLVLVSPPALR